MQEAAAAAALFAFALNAPSRSGSSEGSDSQWMLVCRRLVEQGRPIEALNALQQALVARGCGDVALRAIDQVKQALQTGGSEAHVTHQLAALMAALSVGGPAFGTAPPAPAAATAAAVTAAAAAAPPPPGSAPGGAAAMDTDADAPTDQQRRELLAAQAEGESYICPACSGVVSLARRDTHESLWCPGHQR